MIRECLTRMRFLLFRKKRSELDEELAFHLDQAVAARVACGIDPGEARRQALIDFGGVERTREHCQEQRPGWWIETLAQDLRYALRGFRRNALFSVTVLLTLALGIGATIAVLSVVDRILFRPLPYADGSRLVSVGLVQPLEKQEFTLGGFYFDWQANQRAFSSMSFEQGTQECNVTDKNPARLHCAAVAANFLSTLGVAPLLGRNFLPEEDAPKAPQTTLISDALWLTRYNRSRNVLNQTIEIDGHPVRIIGVLPRNFEMPRLQAADLLLPAQVDIAAQHTVNAGIGSPMWAFARLKPGASLEAARAEMEPLFRHTQMWIPAQFRSQFHLQIRSLRDRQMQDAYRASWVLLGAALAILSIACANVAGLFSARGAVKARELAVRSALGATRLRIARQALTEALLLALAGATLGCLLAVMLLRIFIAIAPSGVPFLADARLDGRIAAFAVLLAFVCAVACALAPALERPASIAMTARTANGLGHSRMRRFLVAAQIAVSIVLLSGAGLFIRSFRNLEHESLGMQTTNVLTVRIPLVEARYQASHAYMNFYQRVEAAMRRLPGVQAVSISDSLPPDGHSWHGGVGYTDFLVVGRPPIPPEHRAAVVRRMVTPEYFHLLHIPILLGRGFSEEERNGGGYFLVLSRQLAARLFPQGKAIGQHLRFANYRPYLVLDGPVYTVVGVAGDVKNAGLAGQDDPEFYELWSSRRAEDWGRHCVFLMETTLPPAIVTAWLRAEIAKLDPTAPVEVESMTQAVTRLADQPRFETVLVSLFAACGLLLAVIGLYGVIAFIVAQRTSETGIRMALGATRMDILRLIAGEGMRLVALGGLCGLATALAEERLLRDLLFEVPRYDPDLYIAVTLLLAFVALIATLIPARSAMSVEPAVALRNQ